MKRWAVNFNIDLGWFRVLFRQTLTDSHMIAAVSSCGGFYLVWHSQDPNDPNDPYLTIKSSRKSNGGNVQFPSFSIDTGAKKTWWDLFVELWSLLHSTTFWLRRLRCFALHMVAKSGNHLKRWPLGWNFGRTSVSPFSCVSTGSIL